MPVHQAAREGIGMHVAYIIVAAIFTVMLTMSARMKLVRDPLAVEVINGAVGVPLGLFPVLALLEIAGGAGLLVGIGLEWIGVAAAGGLGAALLVAGAAPPPPGGLGARPPAPAGAGGAFLRAAPG